MAACGACWFYNGGLCVRTVPTVIPDKGSFWPRVKETDWCGDYSATDPHIYAGSTTGPQGPAGVPGTQGPVGARGVAGATGASGLRSKGTIAFTGPGTVTVNDAQIQTDSHVSLTPTNYVDGTVAYWCYHDIVDGVSFQASLYNAVAGAINFSYAIF